MQYLSLPFLKLIQLKAIILSVLAFIVIVSSALFITNRTVTASESNIRTKRVTSIRIEAGDTLWSIAKRYITPEYSNINEYIKEIKNSNGITSDTIHENRYIIVPYYDL